MVWISVAEVVRPSLRVAIMEMTATAIPAAMRPYSMAVAPYSSWAKRTNSFFIF